MLCFPGGRREEGKGVVMVVREGGGDEGRGGEKAVLHFRRKRRRVGASLPERCSNQIPLFWLPFIFLLFFLSRNMIRGRHGGRLGLELGGDAA